MKKMIFICLMQILAGSVFAQENTPSLIKEVLNDENETLVADSFQRTLYIFDLDQGKSTPACTGDCAEIWPPYLITGQEASTLASPLGSIKRANGKLQLTYNGSPVYTYASDRKAGDDLGDALGGVWHYIEIEK